MALYEIKHLDFKNIVQNFFGTSPLNYTCTLLNQFLTEKEKGRQAVFLK